MLDPVACARLEFGEPLVSLSALVELHHFLIESGFRKNSRKNMSCFREDTDEKPLARHSGRRMTSSRWLSTQANYGR